MPFICPSCKEETNKLIAIGEGQVESHIGCPKCHIPRQDFTNVRLGQTFDSWISEKDGSKHRISEGKKWEIDHRIVSKDDKKTVVNSATGKVTQY